MASTDQIQPTADSSRAPPHSLDDVAVQSTSRSPSPTPQIPTRPAFAPFFTLVEDSNTQTQYHPSVHYIFSDDDTDLITEASLRVLSPPSTSSRQPSRRGQTDGSSTSSDLHRSSSALPPPRPGVQERYLVLDVSPTGDAVTTAHSLSSDWQILGVDVTKAPAWDNGTAGSTSGVPGEQGPAPGGDAGLMLRVEGTGSLGGTRGRDEDEPGISQPQNTQELVDLFQSRMETLRRIMRESDKATDGER